MIDEAEHDTELDSDLLGDEPKVAEDVCRSEVERFLTAMDIDSDKSKMDDEDRAGFDSAVNRLITAMQAGRLHINDDGEPVFQPTSGPEVRFPEPTGAAYMEMDRRKKGHDVSKMVALMAGISGHPPKVFANMKNRDFKVCQSIVTLFLG
jgi:hypothetical protein